MDQTREREFLPLSFIYNQCTGVHHLLMVLGGSNSGLEKDIELFDLRDLSKNCTKPPNPLNEIDGSLAAILDGKVHACGHYLAEDECQVYSPISKEWSISQNYRKVEIHHELFSNPVLIWVPSGDVAQ